MSRWLWALLGGVVLVAIAAVFWTASNRTNVTPPVSPGPATVTPGPSAPAPVAQEPAPSSAPAPAAQQAAPSPPPAPASPAAKEAAAPPLLPLRPRRLSSSGARCGTASRLAASCRAFRREALRSAGRRAGASPPPAAAPLADAPLPPPAPERETPEAASPYAPKSLAQLVGAWAYSAEDCDKVFQRSGSGWAYRQPVDKFAQAAIVESPKRILLPSATCQIEGSSEVEGALKVTAECADSISFTSRSTVIMLRSATELVYSASGDPVLATTLKKCTP